MSGFLFIGGPLHGQIHDGHPALTTYVCEVPRKRDFSYADFAPDAPMPRFDVKTDRVYYELNREFEDYVFTLERATAAEIDRDYLAWRNEQEALVA